MFKTYNIGNEVIEVELPSSLQELDDRISELKIRQEGLNIDLAFYKENNDFSKKSAIGQKMKLVQMELHILNMWRKNCAFYLQQKLDKSSYSNSLELATIEGLLKHLYLFSTKLIDKKKYECNSDEYALLDAVNYFLRQHLSNNLLNSGKIDEPQALINEEKAIADLLKESASNNNGSNHKEFYQIATVQALLENLLVRVAALEARNQVTDSLFSRS